MSTVQELVRREALAQGVDPELAAAVAWQESRFNQQARSSAGAIGVMQLMPRTAMQLGVDPHDIRQNIRGGVRYLRQMLSMFAGNIEKALAAYNWGPGAVAKALREWGADWLNHVPSETRNYVAVITRRIGGPPQATFRVEVASTPKVPDWARAVLGLLAVAVVTR